MKLQQIRTIRSMITRMVLGHKLPVSIANDIDTGSLQNYWLASQPTNRTRDAYRRTSLDIPTVMELEDEVTSVQDEEVPADLDSKLLRSVPDTVGILR